MITLPAAATLLGLTPSALRKAIAAGRIPGAKKVGRDWFVPNPPKIAPDRRKRVERK